MSVGETKPAADLGRLVGLDRYDYADTFFTEAPAHVGGDVQRAVRRFVMSAPWWTRAMMVARDLLAGLIDRAAERHAARASDEAKPVVGGERVGMFRVYRVDPDEVVIGDDDRLMRYRILLRLDPETRRFTCATVVEHHGLLGRLYLKVGLWAHRAFVRATMRRFAESG